MTKISNLYGLTNYVTANSSGNVVIAAPTSGTALYVTGSAQVTGQLTLGSTITNGTYTYTLPSATGTLALASSLGSYLPLTGGTLTGALNGTSGTFTGNISTSAQLRIESSGNAILVIGSRTSGTVFEVYNSSNILRFYNGTVEALKIETGAGAATFSSSVTATSVSATDATGSAILTTNGGGEGVLSVNTANPLRFFTNGSEKMRITSGGNVGIGTSSPSQKLHLTGSGNVVSLVETAAGSFAQYQLLAGSGGTPWIFGTQVDYLSNSLVFRYSTNKMVLTTGGNLGIGTDSPTAFSGYTSLTIDNTSGSFTEYRQGGTNTFRVGSNESSGGFLYTQGSTPVRFGTIDTERMRITSDGVLQFSTTSVVPTTNNAIYSYASNGYMYIQGGSTGVALAGSGDRNNAVYVNTSINSILFHTNGAGERMRITSSGQIAIGTSNPQSGNNIQVNSTSPIFALYSGQTDTTTNLVYSTIMFKSYAGLYNQQFQQPDAQIQIVRGNHSYNGHQSTHDADMVFSTNDNVNGAGVTERMRIWSTGELVLVANSGGSNHIRFINNNGVYWEIFNATNYNKFTFIYQGSYVADINPSSGAYTALSDERKKKDIEASNIGLSTILALQPSLFRMKTDDDSQPKQLGFIAQQVESVLPEACSNVGDYLGVQDRPIVAALVKAIQELKAELDTLKNK